MRKRKLLYERRKEKGFYASGSWSLTPKEKRLLSIVCYIFFFSIIAILAGSSIHIYSGKMREFLIGSIICGILSFILLFVTMIGLVIKKSKSEPMVKQTYDIDYSYNAITGEIIDNLQEQKSDDVSFEKETEA